MNSRAGHDVDELTRLRAGVERLRAENAALAEAARHRPGSANPGAGEPGEARDAAGPAATRPGRASRC